MLPTFYRDTVTRLRATTQTVRGSLVYDWSSPDSKDIAGCHMQPASTSLSLDGRVLGISDGYTCYLPADADVKAGDHIVFNGNTYTINGDIRWWPSATGGLDHIQLNLMRWEG